MSSSQKTVLITLNRPSLNYLLTFGLLLAGCSFSANPPLISPIRAVISNLNAQTRTVKTTTQSSNTTSHGHANEHFPAVSINRQQLPVVQVNRLSPPVPPPLNTPTIPVEPPQSTMLFSSGSSGDAPSAPVTAVAEQLQPNHQLAISDVVLTENSQSIVSTNATSTAAIIPNYAGKEVSITIHGTFNTAPETTLEHMQFWMEPGLLHQSLVGKEPSVRVLLDSTILWTPVTVSANQIVAKLQTQGIPDLYLKGNSHTLRVEAGQLIAEVPVRVGEPEAPAKLSPAVTQIEILRDDQNRPLNLKITGKNLMLYYRFSYVQVDGKPVFGHQTNVIADSIGLSWEKIIHLPEDFVEAGAHTLLYTTPYGAAFKGFGG